MHGKRGRTRGTRQQGHRRAVCLLFVAVVVTFRARTRLRKVADRGCCSGVLMKMRAGGAHLHSAVTQAPPTHPSHPMSALAAALFPRNRWQMAVHLHLQVFCLHVMDGIGSRQLTARQPVAGAFNRLGLSSFLSRPPSTSVWTAYGRKAMNAFSLQDRNHGVLVAPQVILPR
ncbi:hypothetical protein B0T19DRAFT_42118 [Cercophora scortea]|uniref:Uncharacterized protein n=1 Tax=Cercophora scortea TaxID=314031 RepID=A0AAE0J4T8_9PEZI|nr:hypothetical protein B0T19DRAFT_42118 [Cercophora scortea]